MIDPIDVIEELYGSRYKGDPLWHNVVKKLSVRQAYVFYYSLAYLEKNTTAVALGIFDLPDKNEVHRSLMDALRKEQNPNEAARIIADNTHNILINDNDLLWIKTELRAALWSSHFVITNDNANKKLLSDLLRSNSEAEFTSRLIHVIDIFGCGLRGETAQTIRVMFDKSETLLFANHQSLFNKNRGNYVSNRIDDHHLNWLNKLPLDEIDAILEKFKAEEILVLVGIFVPVNKKDKVALIKASLDMQQYRHMNEQNNESLVGNNANVNVGKTYYSSNEPKNADADKRIKKKFAKLSAYEIIKLLVNARISRENRKVRSITKNDRRLMLNKEAHSILIELSGQLNATPKKTIEALIKKFDLENAHEVSEIDKLISGKRSVKGKSPLEKPIKQEESVKLAEPIEVEETVEIEESIEPKKAIEPEEIADSEKSIKPDEPFEFENSIEVEPNKAINTIVQSNHETYNDEFQNSAKANSENNDITVAVDTTSIDNSEEAGFDNPAPISKQPTLNNRVKRKDKSYYNMANMMHRKK